MHWHAPGIGPLRGLGSVGTGVLYHPQLGQEVRYRVDEVPEGGDEQTSVVISLMRGYAVEDAASPEIQRDAQEALSQFPGMHPEEAVWNYVRSRMAFVRDEQTAAPFQPLYQFPIVETLIRPRDLSVLCESAHCQRQGDCDDYAMYTAALLLALGIPCSFVTVAADTANDEYSHVYVAAFPPGRGRVAMDTSHGSAPGWETPHYHRKQEWDLVATCSFNTLIGLTTLALTVWMLWRQQRKDTWT